MRKAPILLLVALFLFILSIALYRFQANSTICLIIGFCALIMVSISHAVRQSEQKKEIEEQAKLREIREQKEKAHAKRMQKEGKHI